MSSAGSRGRSSSARLMLTLLPPERWLFRPDAPSRDLIRYGLGLAEEPPACLLGLSGLSESPARDFAPLALNRLAREGRPEDVPEQWRQGSGRLVRRTTSILGEVKRVLSSLQGPGIPVMLLKGLPLILLHYRNLSIRPMADADLLIPLERLSEALEILRADGFLPTLEAPRGLASAPGHVDHSVALRRGSNPEVDLHYYALDECRWPGADDGLWRRSESRTMLGVPARVPGPTDLLLHLCAHGYRVQRNAPRWAADAGRLLLDRGGDVDWDLLVEEARRRRLVLPLESCLRCLHDGLGLPVPERALHGLRESAIGPWEPFDFWVRAGTSLEGRSRRVFLAAVDYLRHASGLGVGPSGSGFLRYLAARWGLGGPADLVGEVARRTLHVLQGRPAREPSKER